MSIRNQFTRGFTLIELVIVIIILGIVSVGVSNFVGSGAQIFVDTTERTQLVNQSRFVVQRLNRELRNALPNSLRLSGNSSIHCLEFVPIVWSTFYLDIPVAPEPISDRIQVVAWSSLDEYAYSANHRIVIYPTSGADVYGSSTLNTYPFTDPGARSGELILLELGSAIHFTTDSPSSRLYIVDQPVSYCVASGEIVRYSNYGFNETQDTSLSSGVLMAQNVINVLSGTAGSVQGDPFQITDASLTRSATVINLLRFELGNESVVYNNEAHIPNVP